MSAPTEHALTETEWGVYWGDDQSGERDFELRDDEADARRVAAEHPGGVVSVVSRTVTYGRWTTS